MAIKNEPPTDEPPVEDPPAATNADLVAKIADPAAGPKDKWAPMMKAMEPQLALALAGPQGVPMIAPERFLRLALTAIRRSPALQEADQMSLLGSIMTCAQLGLEPSGPLGHAYLVPFREKGTLFVQLIIGYQGFIQLAYRSGMVASLSGEVVREGDLFEWEKGTNEFLRHKAKEGTKPVTHSWALAKLVTGGTPFVVLDREEIDATRKRAKTDKIWTSDFDAMARKTAVRRLFRWLPASVEVRGALGADNGIVRGIPASIEEIEGVIDTEGEEVEAAEAV